MPRLAMLTSDELTSTPYSNTGVPERGSGMYFDGSARRLGPAEGF